ncbi:MAG: hypothetical protein EP329_02380 [Deltaproteobacteria bacterium]|nr:MAG: hypothetical protein EP329_02380 [Deltaproteobacteria bacterium]
MRLAVPAALAVCAVALTPAAALACSHIGNEAYTIDPAEEGVDTTPPSALVDAEVTVSRRGTAGDCGGVSSCDDIGVFSIVLTPGGDDRTAADDLGYRVTVVSGRLPQGLILPPGTLQPALPNELFFVWIDGRTDTQEAFDAVLGLVPVDRAGNEGPMLTVHLRDEGSGCAAGGRVPDQALWLGLALLALVAHRERARRRSLIA